MSVKKKYRVSLIIWVLITLISIIPLNLAIAYFQSQQPQAILVLGGDPSRVKFAIKLMQQHPKMKVWLSDNPSSYEANSQIFREAGMSQKLVRYDFCATDTVTNFTCNIEDFQKEGIRHLYLITSNYHMARAITIATLVLGSNKIIVTPVPVPSTSGQSDSLMKIFRDALRSILWIITGYTGASLNSRL